MSRAEKPPKVVLIMSGLPTEGKTTTCLNTAAAFAIQGDSVLYIDADLRRAQAHKSFSSSNDVGLSNCLTSGVSYKEALVPYPGIDSLFLLAAGPHPPNPSELIGSKRFVELLAELRKHFDYIFIDSPPVLLVTDAQLLSSLVDGYVVVIRAGTTKKRALQRSLFLMRAPGTTSLGIVMNALNTSSESYLGYGYYGKGSGYYVEEQR
jgi:succinoglycan biosynthesis transport protein ExoP